MNGLCSAIIAAVLTGTLPPTVDVHPLSDRRASGAIVASQASGREDQLAALRARARDRIEREAAVFTAAELADIETRYASAQALDVRSGFRPDSPATVLLSASERRQILEDLVRRYPRSNRAGCARLQLALLTSGGQREQYLRQAIANDNDAWFESGVQVAAMGRAMLAVHLAGLGQFDEAERLATELVTRFPGSVDYSGATLDETVAGIKLLRK